MLVKIVLRTIRKSIGRYLAIFSIIALGVGFFAGLRVTEESMRKTLDGYLKELNLYDFKLVSTLGLTDEDAEAFAALDGVKEARGSYSADFIYLTETGSDSVLHAHTLLDGVNGMDLVSGIFPESADECVLDNALSGTVSIGDEIVFSENNSEETFDSFAYSSYKVTGFVNASEYFHFDRGSTSLAGGSVSGYAYMLPEGFTADYYTELYLTIPSDAEIYSDEYNEALDSLRGSAEDLLNERADIRYNDIYSEAKSETDKAQAELDDKKNELEQAQAELEDGWAQYRSERAAAEERLAATKQELDSAKSEIDAGRSELEAAKADPSAQLPEVAAQLEAAENALNQSEKEYEQGLAAYNEAAAEAQAGFEETEKKLSDSQKEIDDALPELEDAQQEIDDAAAQLAEIKPATVYVLDRSSNVGYASFENDINIVSGVAKVFPLFFFLVAALVCITTITRMVSEQRTENGVLKALGYGGGAVAGQYLFYAGSASAMGCAAGFIIGSRFLPMVLWQVYHIMYSVDRPVVFVLNWGLFAVCTLLYLACALGAAWFVCLKDLKESAAQLIRPKSPEAGKRIIFERITFIWSRLKFLHKVSVRNIMRYKKRMVMMIIGIGGCTALLLTGFGIRDTIQPVIDYQYNEITLYDASVSFLEEIDDEGRNTFSEETESVAEDIIFLRSESVDAQTQKGDQPINLAVFDHAPDGFIDLHDGSRKIAFPEKGEAVINYRFAKENNISVGDELKLRDGELRTLTVTVSDIFDNYFYDYVYLSSETYKEQLSVAPACNTAYVNFKEGQDVRSAGALMLSDDNVASVTASEDMITRIEGMLDSLNYIVLIVLICAGALAFIVLYNLTNITITERTREIATLKVLGFYINEQNSYVFRENLILTGVSTLCGIPMGIALLNYVMAQIKISNFYFGCRLSPLSYLWAVLLTFAFTLIVDLALTGKMKHINMAEAMKVIE